MCWQVLTVLAVSYLAALLAILGSIVVVHSGRNHAHLLIDRLANFDHGLINSDLGYSIIGFLYHPESSSDDVLPDTLQDMELNLTMDVSDLAKSDHNNQPLYTLNNVAVFTLEFSLTSAWHSERDYADETIDLKSSQLNRYEDQASTARILGCESVLFKDNDLDLLLHNISSDNQGRSAGFPNRIFSSIINRLNAITHGHLAFRTKQPAVGELLTAQKCQLKDSLPEVVLPGCSLGKHLLDHIATIP